MEQSFVDQAITLTNGGTNYGVCLVLAQPEVVRRQILIAIRTELESIGLQPFPIKQGCVVAHKLEFVVCPPLPSIVCRLSPVLVVYGHDGYTREVHQFLQTRPGIQFYAASGCS